MVLLLFNKSSRMVRWLLSSLWLVMLPLLGWGQVTLNPNVSSYTESFDGVGTGLPPGFTVRTGATATTLGTSTTFTTTSTLANSTTGAFRNTASADGFTNATYTANSGSAQTSAADRVIGLRQSASFGNPGGGFVFQLANTTNISGLSTTFKLQSLDASSGQTTTYTVDYRIGTTGSFTPVTPTSGSTVVMGSVFSNSTVTVNFGAALDNSSDPVYIRIVALTATTGSGNRATTGLDDFTLTYTAGTAPAPTTSIATDNPTGTPVCANAGGSITVTYTPTGTFNASNVFTAQLSNATGSFASPVNLITTASGTNSLTVTIPTTVVSGTGYLVRVNGSDPATTGQPNSTPFTITNSTVAIAPTAIQNIATGANGNQLTATETPAAASRQWVYATIPTGTYTNITNATGTTYTPTFPSAGTYYVAVQSTFATCGTITSNQVQVNVSDPTLIVSPNSLNPFSTTQGTASAFQTYNLAGTNLTSLVTVTAPTGYEIAQSVGTSTTTTNLTYSTSLTVTATQAQTSTGRTIYVRLAAAAVIGTPAGNVTNEATGAATQNVAVSGTVTAPAPAITVTGTLAAFNTLAGQPSTAQTINVSGSNLTGGIDITPPAGYEVSINGGTYSSSAQTLGAAGTVASTPVQVRLTGTTPTASLGTSLLIRSAGAANQDRTVSGTVVGEPTTAPTVVAGTPGTTSVTLTVSGGDGARRLLVVRAATSAAAIPNDQTTYTANLAFGNTSNGTITGVSNYVVLASTATTATVTGLAASTAYVAEVYAYNGGTVDGFENYLPTAGTASFTTATAPITSACLTEGFESTTFPPTGWLASSVSRATTNGSAKTGIAAAAFSFNNAGTLTTPVLANPSSLSFALGRTTDTTPKTLTVAVATDSQTGTFNTVTVFDHSNVTGGSYNTYTVDLSAYAASPQVWVRFTKAGATTSAWRLDDVAVTCNAATAPAISVAQGGTTITSGTGNYAFGSTNVGTTSDVTFTIANTGAGSLALNGTPTVAITGTDASQFSIIQQPTTTVTTSTPTSFVLRFAPTSGGAKSAGISIASNDPASVRNPYTFALSGTGIAASLVATSNNLTYNVLTGTTTVQSYTLTGINVGANASVAISSNNAAVTVSTDSGITYATTGTVTANASGAVNSTVRVRFTASTTPSVTTTIISNTSGNLSAPVTVNGNVTVDASVAGTLLFEDDFDYIDGEQLTLHGWAGGSSNNTVTVSGNVTTTGYPQGAALSSLPAGTSTKALLTKAGPGVIYRLASIPADATTLYASTLINILSPENGTDYFLTFRTGGTTTSYYGRINVTKVAGSTPETFTFGLRAANEASPTTNPKVFNTNTTYILVLKVENSAATNNDDVYSLYVLDANADLRREPTTPLITTSNGGSFFNTLGAFAIRQQDANSPRAYIDGVRFATGWGAAVGNPVYTAANTTAEAGNYYSLTLNSAGSLTPNGAVNVEGLLTLTSGIVNTTAANILSLNQTATVSGGADNSFVNGPVRRPVGGVNAATSFVFPVGKGTAYRPLTLNIAAQTSSTVYQAEQFEGNPGQTIAAQTNRTPLQRVNANRSYTVTPYNGSGVVTQPTGFSGTVTLSYDTNDQVNNPNDPTLVIGKRANASAAWVNIGRADSASTATATPGAYAAGTLTSAPFTSFSDFALASTTDNTTNNPLPVSLTRFSATRATSGVQVAWATASEKNSDYFEVQRSLDGSTFASVAKVVANGTTTQSHTYASLDGTAPAALLYYRLRQVDLDGTVAYSPVVSVAADGTTSEFTLAPNPAHDRISFLTALPTTYSVRNTLGQLVRSGTTVAGTNDLLVEGLPAGVYFFELHGGAGRVVRKFVKE